MIFGQLLKFRLTYLNEPWYKFYDLLNQENIAYINHKFKILMLYDYS
jgi:hypothetical protein